MKRIAEPIETIELCSYGCGNVAKYRNGSGNLMCCERSNSCPAVRRKSKEKLIVAHAEGRMNTNFGGKRSAWNKGCYNADFCLNGKGNHKAILILERGHVCEICNMTEWLNKPITLELEHSDGNNKNNTRDNLKLLCPNCHSQTPTWRRKKSALLVEQQTQRS